MANNNQQAPNRRQNTTLMSSSHHYSYNPFSLRRLRYFLRKNWLALIILCIIFAFALPLLDRLLPSLPPRIFFSEPILENPGPIDLEKGQAPSPGGSQLDRLVHRSLAMGPDGALVLLTFRNLAGESRYDLVNLATRENVFLAAFKPGEFWTYPLYRPEYHEILITRIGPKESFGERLLMKAQIPLQPRPTYTMAIMPEPKTYIYRLNPETGAYLGQLEFPFDLDPVDVSPNGRFLLALTNIQVSGGGFGQLTVFDLVSGESMELPCFKKMHPRDCFFESNEAILLVLDSTVFRFLLDEQRFEQIFAFPPAFSVSGMLNDFSSARQTRKLYFLSNFAQGSGFKISCLSLDDLPTVEHWDWDYTYSTGQYLPERELSIMPLTIYEQGIIELRTGKELIAFPPGVVPPCTGGGGFEKHENPCFGPTPDTANFSRPLKNEKIRPSGN